MPRDYYIVLGINREADAQKIKKAYRTVAKKYHPDVTHSPESRERFLEIKEAYETLGDEKKRKRYDEELTRQGSSLRITMVPDIIKRRASSFDEMDAFHSSVYDFFSGFLPGFFDHERRMEKDLYFEIILTPQEASQGGLFPVTIPVIEPLKRAHSPQLAAGLASVSKKGKLPYGRRFPAACCGELQSCHRCHKTGFYEDFFCPVCSGYGRVQSEREFSISIPPRVKHGTEVRLSLRDIGLQGADLNIAVFIDPDLEEDLWRLP